MENPRPQHRLLDQLQHCVRCGVHQAKDRRGLCLGCEHELFDERKSTKRLAVFASCVESCRIVRLFWPTMPGRVYVASMQMRGPRANAAPGSLTLNATSMQGLQNAARLDLSPMTPHGVRGHSCLECAWQALKRYEGWTRSVRSRSRTGGVSSPRASAAAR